MAQTATLTHTLADRDQLIGEVITNLKMPPMNMVFRLASPTLLEGLAVGDAVSFHAENPAGKLTVTAIQKQ